MANGKIIQPGEESIISDIEERLPELVSDEMKREKIGNTSNKENKQEPQKKQLQQLKKAASTVLFRAKTIFPFDLFPDEVVVDYNKVSIIHHSFWSTYYVEDLLISEIASIKVSTIPFFGSISVYTKRDPGNPTTVSFMKRGDAEKAKRIIEGLSITQGKNVDISKFSPQELKPTIEKIGSAKPSFS